MGVFLLGAAGRLSVSGVSIVLTSPWNYGVMTIAVVCFGFGLALAVAEHRRSSRTLQVWSPDQFGQTVSISGFARSHIPEFYGEVEKRIAHAHHIKFISMGLQILREGNILDVLVKRAIHGDVNVVACMGNPYSPDVVDRLIEEETSDTQPQIGRHG